MITLFWGCLLSLWYVKLSFDVINKRKSLLISLGPGKNNEILKEVSIHNNFSNYIPLILVLMGAGELTGVYPKVFVFIIGAIVFFGRLAHHYGIHQQRKTKGKVRILGMVSTLFPMMILSLSGNVLVIKMWISRGGL